MSRNLHLVLYLRRCLPLLRLIKQTLLKTAMKFHDSTRIQNETDDERFTTSEVDRFFVPCFTYFSWKDASDSIEANNIRISRLCSDEAKRKRDLKFKHTFLRGFLALFSRKHFYNIPGLPAPINENSHHP